MFVRAVLTAVLALPFVAMSAPMEKRSILGIDTFDHGGSFRGSSIVDGTDATMGL